MVKVAAKVVAQTGAGWAAQLKEWGYNEVYIQIQMARRKRDGNSLFLRVAGTESELHLTDLDGGRALHLGAEERAEALLLLHLAVGGSARGEG